MNGAIVNGALLRVERARDKSRPARWVAPNGGGVGPFRPRLRRGGGAGAAAGSYHQAGLERKMMRRVPESTAAPSPQETTAPMQAGYTDGAAPGAPAYGYDYAATAAMADPYAAPPAYAPGLPARMYRMENSWEQWEALLASSDPEVQLALLDHVRQAAQASGALDMGPHPSSS
ncbi:hypothetical protein HPB51_004585 [Rhipicephalus microplus]|uniref:Uncharacterized protein n=1 Tax=Rhipicephalus microplus TaxID=6941 RepID=A0A9J6EMV8_RHIMP|nr:hypothetical protein HPB51_004585 [Rhipicephalus microplus]